MAKSILHAVSSRIAMSVRGPLVRGLILIEVETAYDTDLPCDIHTIIHLKRKVLQYTDCPRDPVMKI